jgi:hypothetical protein
MIAVETGLYFLNVICGLEKEANDVISKFYNLFIRKFRN